MSAENIQKAVDDLNKVGGFGGREGTELRRSLINNCLNNGPQSVHTPFDLCKEMVGKLVETIKNEEFYELNKVDYKNRKYLVICNVEFVETLIFDFDVPPSNITFFADSLCEMSFVMSGYGINDLYKNIFLVSGRKNNEGKDISPIELINSITLRNKDMKFDCVVMNPPYQGDTEKKGLGAARRDIWDKFAEKSIELVKDNGYIANVHPGKWRKPEHDLWDKINKLKMIYLEIHSKTDGQKTFGATTNYDWYVAQKSNKKVKTEIKSEDGVYHKIDMTEIPFLPNKNISNILSLIAKDNEETCEVLYSSSVYEARKKWMSKTKDNEYLYPVVYTINKDGPQYIYSSINNKGHFGTPKVVINMGWYLYPIIDNNGNYGMSNIVFGITYSTEDEAKNIQKALNSEKFNSEVVESCRWMSMQLEWRMFKYFRKDFWKEFV